MSTSRDERPPAAFDRSSGLDKQSIVSAALDIIAERGVPGLSMRLLSQRLGVSLGATYRHVPNKEDLLRLVAADLYGRITPADDTEGDGFDQAKHVMLQIHDVLAAYPGMAAHIAQNIPEFTSERLASLITDPLQAAGLSADEAARIVFTLILLNAGHMLIRVPAGLEDEASAAFEEGVDLILRGAQTRSQHR
ncbi:MAG TPA: helix-turn-helix domain-containing protein [Streptosporangiaceae bacterium]|nr:helix-turn-helix domain-containing protein [Streptosporangiaceae bacterium]